MPPNARTTHNDAEVSGRRNKRQNSDIWQEEWAFFIGVGPYRLSCDHHQR
jgi:hypothetical protein